MSPEQWSSMFGMNGYVIQAVTDGLTQEDSLRQPQPAGNCLNWVLGHIVFYRNSILQLVGAEQVWGEGEGTVYERGSQPLKSGEGAYPLSRLLEDLNVSQERLLAALGGLRPEQMTAAGENGSIAEQMTKWYFHETYHVGQMGLLRRLAGKEGAIG